MKLTLLGTGTSQGVPVIGCKCAVCASNDPKDNRLRTSALFTDGTVNVLIDTGPDFRQQMLRAHVDRLDAVLMTHEHNDHVIGIDDVRPFNFSSGNPIKVFALQRVANELQKRFEYIFGEPIPGLPRVELITIEPGSQLQFGQTSIEAIDVQHGSLPILGYRIGQLAYLTDAKTLLPEAIERLNGIEYLVVNALQHLPHPTHMSLEEALRLIEVLQPKQSWLIHASHHLGLTSVLDSQLPDSVKMGYDGLEICW